MSVNDCVIKAAALALAEVPAANALWDAGQEAAAPAGSGGHCWLSLLPACRCSMLPQHAGWRCQVPPASCIATAPGPRTPARSARAPPAVDIAVAVATEGGLITPIVRGANAKSLAQISAEVGRAGFMGCEEERGVEGRPATGGAALQRRVERTGDACWQL